MRNTRLYIFALAVALVAVWSLGGSAWAQDKIIAVPELGINYEQLQKLEPNLLPEYDRGDEKEYYTHTELFGYPAKISYFFRDEILYTIHWYWDIPNPGESERQHLVENACKILQNKFDASQGEFWQRSFKLPENSGKHKFYTWVAAGGWLAEQNKYNGYISGRIIMPDNVLRLEATIGKGDPSDLEFLISLIGPDDDAYMSNRNLDSYPIAVMPVPWGSSPHKLMDAKGAPYERSFFSSYCSRLVYSQELLCNQPVSIEYIFTYERLSCVRIVFSTKMEDTGKLFLLLNNIEKELMKGTTANFAAFKGGHHFYETPPSDFNRFAVYKSLSNKETLADNQTEKGGRFAGDDIYPQSRLSYSSQISDEENFMYIGGRYFSPESNSIYVDLYDLHNPCNEDDVKLRNVSEK